MHCPVGDACIAERDSFRDSDLFRKVFENVVARCISEGLVSGVNFATDASLIQADASKMNSTSKEDWDLDTINPETAPRAVVEYLFALGDVAFEAATDVIPKFTSHSGPSSQRLSVIEGNHLPVTDSGASWTSLLCLLQQ